jgi:diaminopimelate decarboxylase
MNSFSLKNGQLHAESVPLSAIAERFGTPCYVYSRAALEAAFDEFKRELDGIDSMICYAVKANSNLAVSSTCSPASAPGSTSFRSAS